RQEGTLELFARGPKALKARLEGAFARIVLGHDLAAWNPGPTYILNHLKDRHFSLATDPEDGVTARVKRMRLSFKNSSRRVTLEADPDGEPDDIYRMLEEVIDRDRVPPSAFNVTLVTFVFEFGGVDGRRPGSMAFDVASPDSCSLRNQRPERVELAL